MRSKDHHYHKDQTEEEVALVADEAKPFWQIGHEKSAKNRPPAVAEPAKYDRGEKENRFLDLEISWVDRIELAGVKGTSQPPDGRSDGERPELEFEGWNTHQLGRVFSTAQSRFDCAVSIETGLQLQPEISLRKE